jgi:hypothetical protein
MTSNNEGFKLPGASETSMVKNLQKKSSNGFANSANGFRTSKNP